MRATVLFATAAALAAAAIPAAPPRGVPSELDLLASRNVVVDLNVETKTPREIFEELGLRAGFTVELDGVISGAPVRGRTYRPAPLREILDDLALRLDVVYAVPRPDRLVVTGNAGRGRTTFPAPPREAP